MVFNRRGSHFDMVVLKAQGVYRVAAKLRVPLFPKFQTPQLFYAVALGDGDMHGRLVGVGW